MQQTHNIAATVLPCSIVEGPDLGAQKVELMHGEIKTTGDIGLRHVIRPATTSCNHLIR